MLVSIIMPVLNGEKYIRETLESVASQTYRNYELIICDGGSTDKTLDIINEYKDKGRCNNIVLFDNLKVSSVAESRNFGISNAKGDYIAFIDADDVWFNNRLEKQIECFNVNKNIDFICSSYELMDEQSNKVKDFIIENKVTYNNLLKTNIVGCSTVIVKKEALDKFKFTADYFHEDLVLWLKLLKNGYKCYGMSEILVRYRLNTQSKSHNKVNSAKNRWLILRDSEKLGLIKSIYYFCIYSINGVIKHKL